MEVKQIKNVLKILEIKLYILGNKTKNILDFRKCISKKLSHTKKNIHISILMLLKYKR